MNYYEEKYQQLMLEVVKTQRELRATRLAKVQAAVGVLRVRGTQHKELEALLDKAVRATADVFTDEILEEIDDRYGDDLIL